MLLKTIRVTNARNVLLQIPSVIIAAWRVKTGSQLEVHYDEATQLITIRQAIPGREYATSQSKRMA